MVTTEEQQYFEGYKPRKRGNASIPKAPGQDVIFDTLERLWVGPGIKGTLTERRKIAIAAEELKALKDKEVNPAEIERRWVQWEKDHPAIPCTPMALAGNWHSLARKKPRVDPAEKAKQEAFVAEVQARNQYVASLSDEEFAELARKAHQFVLENDKKPRSERLRGLPREVYLRNVSRDNPELVNLLWWAEKRRREAEKKQ